MVYKLHANFFFENFADYAKFSASDVQQVRIVSSLFTIVIFDEMHAVE
jgi:hypothetical protein